MDEQTLNQAMYAALGDAANRILEGGLVLTRRDAIAAQLAAALIASPGCVALTTPATEKRVLEQARRMADFLIAELDGARTGEA